MIEDKYNVFASQEYNVPLEILFDLMRSGALFKLTGADNMYFDFCEGGFFLLVFHNRGYIYGKFVQIIVNQKIVMNWNVNGFDRYPEFDTSVFISLFKNSNSMITIEHMDIKLKESALAKQRAWTEILENLKKELEDIF